MNKRKYEKLRNMILKEVTENRMAHTLGVEGSAMKLAKEFGYDVRKASIAACLHDCCKDISDDKLEEYIKANCPKKKTNGESLHAIAAAIKAKKEFGITDKNILSSVEYHSIPRTKMSTLDKIIYLADWIEPNRSGNIYELMRAFTEKNIDEAIINGIDLEIGDALLEGSKINPRFIKARNNLLKKLNK